SVGNKCPHKNTWTLTASVSVLRLGSSGGVGRARRGDVPGQQVRDAVHGVIGDARQDLAQVRFRIESVEFRRADQTVDGGGALAARVGAGEQVVLPAQRDHAQRSFGCVVVDFQAAVVSDLRESLVSETSNHSCKDWSKRRAWVVRTCCRSSGGRPRISFSMAY